MGVLLLFFFPKNTRNIELKTIISWKQVGILMNLKESKTKEKIKMSADEKELIQLIEQIEQVNDKLDKFLDGSYSI